MDTVAVWATISITREAMSLLFVSIIKNRIANKVKNTLIIKPFLNLARKWGNFPFAHARKRRAWTMERCQRERERDTFSARGNRVKTGKVSHGATPIYLCPA